MFRITRGLHLQHLHFPFPLLGRRELDEDSDQEKGTDADPSQSVTPPALEPGADAEADQA